MPQAGLELYILLPEEACATTPGPWSFITEQKVGETRQGGGMEGGGDETGPLSLNLWLSAHHYSGPQETFGPAWKWC